MWNRQIVLMLYLTKFLLAGNLNRQIFSKRSCGGDKREGGREY